jgi:hypothetical protein
MNTTVHADLPAAPQFYWHVADMSDAREAHRIHCEALQGSAQGLVRADGLAHFERHTGADGVMVCCRSPSQEMVAYAILGTHSHNADHLAGLMGISSAQRTRFAILDGVATRPAWRGFHLHQASIMERISHARTIQRTLLAATVSPNNWFSLRGLLDAGFTVSGFAVVYGGLDRLLLMRNLEVHAVAWRPAYSVTSDDIAAHQAALAGGLLGYACSEMGSKQWQVQYGMPADCV